MKKRNKVEIQNATGITLIALIVTIIILVILVGVTVSVAINGGLIRNTQKVASDYNTKQREEQEGIEDLNKQIEIVNMKEIKAGDYAEDSHKKYVSDGKTAYIPAGFTVSNLAGEKSIDTGLVIYSGNHEGEDMTTIQGTANQYVWIPVENPSDMYGTITEADVTLNPNKGLAVGERYGKLYFKTVTDKTTHYNWPSEANYSATSWREPAYLADSTYADDSSYNQEGENKIITEEGIKEEYRKMIRSIETYHGFYIGRYELTGTNGSPSVVQGVKPLANINWYQLYTNCQKLEEGNEKVHTSMIWGSQWDQAVKKALSDKSDFLSNSATYGWYNGDSGSAVHDSGTKTAAYNIFDMGGNVYDWTLEANNSNGRVMRGGGYGNSASDYPAGRRLESFLSNFSSNKGCRPQLYL